MALHFNGVLTSNIRTSMQVHNGRVINELQHKMSGAPMDRKKHKGLWTEKNTRAKLDKLYVKGIYALYPNQIY